MSKNESRGRFTTSVVAGLMLVPLSAVAAYALVGRVQPAEKGMATATTTTATAAMPASQSIVVDPVTASNADLAAACGADGLSLVAREWNGDISDVQQAALDALRQVCAEAGLSLPDPPAPAPIVHRVTVTSPTEPAPTTVPTVGETRDDEHEGESGEHEKEDDEHENEYEAHEEDD